MIRLLLKTCLLVLCLCLLGLSAGWWLAQRPVPIPAGQVDFTVSPGSTARVIAIA